MRVLRPALVAAATLAAAPAAADCTCRGPGGTYDLGRTVCLAGSRLAVCVMEGNVTSWRPTGEACPAASAPAGPRREAVRGTPRPRG